MTPAEIAAYIGAAAWLPQIASWLYRRLKRPTLLVVPEQNAELGYTSYGPLFNIRLAIMADHRDLIVDDFCLDIVHEDGEKRVLHWAGMQEDLGETRDAAGVQQGRLTKEHVPTALRVGTLGPMIERLIRFQEPRFNAVTIPLTQSLVAHFNHLKRTDPDYVTKVLASRELFELGDAREKSFWWKPGRYQVHFRPSATARFRLKRSHYSFKLQTTDVDRLKQNIQSLRMDLEGTIKSNLPDYTKEFPTWNWAYVKLEKQ